MSSKLFTPILGLLLLQASVFSQISDIIFFDFESENSIVIEGDTTNTWQIGVPNKTIFTTSRSGTNAIITDTTNPYPINDTSSFYFTIYKPDYDQYCALWFTFWHKFDTDSITDYGYIDFSYDGGENWHQGTNWYLNFAHFGFSREYVNIGGGFEDPFISGNSYGWVYDQYVMQWNYGVKKGFSEPIYPDSLMIRFNFISDSIQTNKNGWMIDDIHVEKLVCGGIHDLRSANVRIYPNPTQSLLDIQSTNHLIESLEIFDLAGNCMVKKFNIKSNAYSLNVNILKSGVYLLIVSDPNNGKEIIKFVKY